MAKKIAVDLDLLFEISKVIKKDYPELSHLIMKQIYVVKEKKAQDIVFDADF